MFLGCCIQKESVPLVIICSTCRWKLGPLVSLVCVYNHMWWRQHHTGSSLQQPTTAEGGQRLHRQHQRDTALQQYALPQWVYRHIYTMQAAVSSLAGTQANNALSCSCWRLDKLDWMVAVLRVMWGRSHKSSAGVFEPRPSERREAVCWRHCGLWSV